MTENQTPTEKQPITVTEGTEAPFLLYAGDDEKVHVRVLIRAEIIHSTGSGVSVRNPSKLTFKSHNH